MPLPMLRWSAAESRQTAELGEAIKSALLKQPQSPVATMIEGNIVPRGQVEPALPAAVIETMKLFKLIEHEGDQLAPRFQGRMIGPHLVFSDLRQSMRVVRASQDQNTYVDPMWEGPVMSNLLIRGEAGDGLDMGCGCGIIALAMSSYCRRVTALDINPRALMLARFNVALNGVENVEVLESDLFSAVPNAVFDRVVFNAPVGMELLPRNALESGEQILLRFFHELSAHLSPDGVVQMNLCVKDWSRASFFTNLRLWLGENADEYQGLFLELWRVERGLKFQVRRLLSPFVFNGNRGKLLAIKRGQLFLQRNNRPGFRDFATRYNEWAPVMGPEFGEYFIRWAMDSEALTAGPSVALPATAIERVDEERWPQAGGLFKAFLEEARGGEPFAPTFRRPSQNQSTQADFMP
ncbi:methyltransferase [Chelativorans salis]|uniref:Methyltransferase n=1 Tax=Chelativorans salis TaxID=2978478 RepID=A0ABT2LVK0_9HYPH|nr:methyltransferase [Chelativorans sp. EGI FJ00035]MCT7378572.1 methyltransferase [Chelativorans sp. EGI FJ00035]